MNPKRTKKSTANSKETMSKASKNFELPTTKLENWLCGTCLPENRLMSGLCPMSPIYIRVARPLFAL